MSGMADVDQRNEKTSDYRGKIMIGKVVDNNDPKKLHRIRVQVPSIMEDDAENLPWAIAEAVLGGCGEDEVRQNIPMVGSMVCVWFQDGDQHFPVYRGQVMRSGVNLGVLAENYPNRVGFVRQGHHEFIDYSTDLWERFHKSGFTMQVDADGNWTVTGPKDANLNIAGQMNITVKGDANISGKNVSVNASGSMSFKAAGAMSFTAASVAFNRG